MPYVKNTKGSCLSHIPALPFGEHKATEAVVVQVALVPVSSDVMVKEVARIFKGARQ